MIQTKGNGQKSLPFLIFQPIVIAAARIFDLVKFWEGGKKFTHRGVSRTFQAEIFFAERVAHITQMNETFFVAVKLNNFAQDVMNLLKLGVVHGRRRLNFGKRQATIRNVRTFAFDLVKIREGGDKIFQRCEISCAREIICSVTLSMRLARKP